MAETATYVIRFTVAGKEDVDSSKAALGRLDKAVGGVGRQMAAMGAAAISVGAAFGALRAVTERLNELMQESAQLAIEQAQAVAQVDAAIESTGGTAGRTSEQIQDLASSIQRVTTVGDEATLQMASLLLTFKSIRGEIFDRTVRAVVDLSTRMGSLESAALLLGKALDDPVRRASELSRSGIVLSQSQKDLIKSFEELGDRASAQAVILAEVETQFGGAAAAAADAAGGGIKQLNNAIGDLQEELGIGLVQAADEAARALTRFAQSDEAIANARLLGDAIGALVVVMGRYAAVLRELAPAARVVGLSLKNIGDQIPALEVPLAIAAKVLEDVLMTMREIRVEQTESFRGAAVREYQSSIEGLGDAVVVTEAAFERMALATLGWEGSAAELAKTQKDLTDRLEEVNDALDTRRARLAELRASDIGVLADAGFSVEFQQNELRSAMVEAQEEAVDEGLDYLVASWGPGIEETATTALENAAENGAKAVPAVVAELENPMSEVWAQASVDLANAMTQAILSGDVTNALDAFAGILGKVVSQAITNSLTDAQGNIGALGSAAGPLAAAGIGLAFSYYNSVQARNEEKRQKAIRAQEEAARELAETFERLTNFLDSTMGSTLLATRDRIEEINQAIEDSLDINSRYAETLESVAIGTHNLRNELMGIADEGFGDTLLAAQAFNESLPGIAEGLTNLARAGIGAPGGGPLNEAAIGGIAQEDFDRIMGAIGADVDYQEFQEALKDGIEAALALLPEEIDLSALTDNLIQQFQGFTGANEIASIRQTADALEDAIRALEGLGLTSEEVAEKIDEVRAAEERRIALEVGDSMQTILDIWERAGGDQNEIAKKRAEIEQIILKTKLEEARITLEAAGKLSEFYANLIDELSEWLDDVNNLIGSIDVPSIGGISVGGGRGRSRRRNRRRERQQAIADFESALEALTDAGLGSFARESRDLRREYERLIDVARELGRSTSEVTRAFNVAWQAMIDRANEGIVDLLARMRTGDLAPGGARAQLSAAEAEFERLARIAPFDLDARADLASAADQYLRLARDVWGPTGYYRDIFADVEQTLERIVGTGVGSVPDRQLTELRSQTSWLERIYSAISGEEVTAADRSTWQRQDETNRRLDDVARGVWTLTDFTRARTAGLLTEHYKSPEISAA